LAAVTARQQAFATAIGEAVEDVRDAAVRVEEVQRRHGETFGLIGADQRTLGLASLELKL
jgi:hypothetical protein